MWKMFSMNGNHRYYDKLQDLVDFYNGKIHSTIKMKPKDVTKSNESEILRTIYNHPQKIVKKTKFKLGDHVRLSKYKGIFEKGYTPNYGTEIFKIIKINRLHPEMYYLEDYLKEPVIGGVYAHEMIRVKHPDGYLVEKILKRKGEKAFCKFLGFDKSHNAWVDADTIN